MKLLVAIGLLITGGLAFAGETRYEDVAYLEELAIQPVELKTRQRSPLLATRDVRSVQVYLTQGQKVTLLGIGTNQCYVTTRIATGPATGWIDKQALEPLPEAFVTEVESRHADRLARRELIRQHQVAVGMTPDEVLASLGKPDRKSFVKTPDGKEEQWTYITYEYRPSYQDRGEAQGRNRYAVSYRKVPAGQRLVTFRANRVVTFTGADDATPARGLIQP